MAFTVRAQTLTFTTLAGPSSGPGSVDGVGAAASFLKPSGIAADSNGNFYVADSFNFTIRKVTPAGVVTTLAGSAGLSGSADGTGSAARFRGPDGVAIDRGGNVYVADTFNNSIRIGKAALADAATIDSSTGTVGTTRQLDTTTQTATSWQWTLIRRPGASAAALSSTSTRNPRFTPDVADLYVFQLTASNRENEHHHRKFDGHSNAAKQTLERVIRAVPVRIQRLPCSSP